MKFSNNIQKYPVVVDNRLKFMFTNKITENVYAVNKPKIIFQTRRYYNTTLTKVKKYIVNELTSDIDWFNTLFYFFNVHVILLRRIYTPHLFNNIIFVLTE